jgi:hypothetical protein
MYLASGDGGECRGRSSAGGESAEPTDQTLYWRQRESRDGARADAKPIGQTKGDAKLVKRQHPNSQTRSGEMGLEGDGCRQISNAKLTIESVGTSDTSGCRRRGLKGMIET